MANEIRSLANIVYADGPSSDPSNPRKDGPEGVRALFGLVEDRINSTDNDADGKVAAERQAREQAIADEAAAREAADQGLSDRLDLIDLGVTVSYETRAELYSDLAHPADTIGHVVGDSTEAYRGVYKKSGGSGSGSWTRIGPLPMVTNAASASVSGLMTPAMFNDLDRSYKPRGTLASDANLNTIIAPGTYQGLATADMVGLPEGLAIGASFYLTILPYGWLVGSGSNNRFVPQTIELMTNRSVTWKRRLDQQNPTSTVGANAWKKNSAQWTAIIASTDINTVIADGLYLLTSGNTHLPEGWIGGGGLRVHDFDGSYVKQTIFNLSNPSISYSRTLRPAQEIVNPWYPVGGGSSGSSRFSGKKIVCFGDSITEGGSGFSYPSILANIFGATVVNGGFGGCRMAVHDHPSVGALYDPMCMYRISERFVDDSWQTLIDAADALYLAEGDDNRPQANALAALDWSTVDYAVIVYGTNDFSGTGGMGVPIGTDGDTTGATFKGAINVTINNIMTARPNIKLLFVTPMWRSRVTASGDDSNVKPNGSGVFLREYCEAIISRAEAFQIPVFDLYKECAINILNWETYTPDGLHPWSAAGVDLLASKIAAGLERAY